jgi:hypothetical protein
LRALEKGMNSAGLTAAVAAGFSEYILLLQAENSVISTIGTKRSNSFFMKLAFDFC